MNYLSAFRVLVFLAILPSYFAVAQSANPPNVVIILADDLGYGDLSCYGHPLIETAHLDNMADEGLRLTSFYVAAPSCTPSRAALMTGRYPLRSGLPYVIFPKEDKGIPASEITLAEALKDRGYRTMCIGKWHLGQTREEFFPTSQGFDNYYGLITSNDMKRPFVQTDVPLRLYRDMEPVEEFPVDQTRLTARYTEEAVKFIEEARDTPFFLYLAHSMPHAPLSTSPAFEGKSAAGLYGDVIEELDWSVGELLKALKENGIDRQTIVIFTSDNGPWQYMPDRMYDGGFVQPWDAGSAGPLKGAKGSSYEGGFRVPCIIRWPAAIPAGQVTPQVATSMDLYPTLLAAAGGTVPQDREIDGVDVMALLKGDRTFERGTDFYYFEGKNLDAIRSGDWKLRIAPYAGHGVPRNDALKPELYNLATDPGELYNQAERHPDIVDALKEKMKSFRMDGAVKRFNEQKDDDK